MTNIVISGYYGFGNAGDEAMLSALLDSLQDVIHDADITVITGNCKATEANHGVHTVGRMDILGIVKAIHQSHILIFGGGSLLQDVTSSRSLFYYLAIIRIALFFHKPVMLYAQGIGPLISPRARKSVCSVLQRVDMIGVRDQASKDELASIGVTKPPIEVTADAVLSIHPVTKNSGAALLRKQGLSQADGTKIGICVREWKKQTHYKEEIAKAADMLMESGGTRIVFIPMQFPDDIKTAEEIAAHMVHEPVILSGHYNTTELMSVIGNMDVLLGIRLHALVFAALMKIPEIAISYDPKIDRFMGMIGEQLCGSIETVTADMLVQAIHGKLQQKTPAREVLENVAALRTRSLHNAQLALQVIEKYIN